MDQKITEQDLQHLVNDKEPDAEALAYEEKIALLQTERINLRVSPSVFDALLGHAEYNKMNVEDYCLDVLTNHLQTSVGAATISSPSTMSGMAAKKVVGPTYSVTRG